jgi:endonuclease/exonuclease/phosphatase family metal-dependent hydrolase
VPNNIRRFSKRFFIIVNVITALVFLLSCLVPYLNPSRWWFIAFLGLGFPIVLLLVIAFAVFWLILKPKFALIPVVTLLLGYKSISVFFAFHKQPPAFITAKDSNTLRIATWNVARFIELKKNKNKGSQTRMKMMEQIKEQNADVLCLQEFFHSDDNAYYPNLYYIRDKLNYPYYYFSFGNDGYRHYIGTVIFSRFPIIDSGMVEFPKPSLPDAVLHIDIKFNDDTVRIYSTHLQSVQFRKTDYENIDGIKKADDSLLRRSKTILSKLKRGFTNRGMQARIVKQRLDESLFPKLMCGDFNDVPNSYAYFTIRGNMQDAFLKKGYGIGRTFSSLSPTLRIDYILADNTFKILQFKRIIKDYSDHYMLVADIQLKQTKP